MEFSRHKSMNLRSLFFILLVILTATTIPGRILAVSIEELEAQIQARQREIEKLEQQAAVYKQKIQQTKTEEKTLANQIYILENQIEKFRLDIRVTQEQIVSTTLSIQDLQFKIQEREIDIKKNRNNLENIVQTINEYDQQSALEMMLGHESFSDFLNQDQYVRNLEASVNQKVKDLKELKSQMENQKTSQQEKQLALEDLRVTLVENQSSLNSQADEKEYLLNKTKGQEKEYQKVLNELIAKKSAFAKEVQAIEQQIIAAKNYLLFVSGEIPPAGTKIFAWPEESPVITQGYGMTAFAKQGAYGGSPHNGVDMSDGYGSKIKSIGPGEVLARGSNKGWGNWVAVKHTNGLVSLYAHMKSSAVLATGAKVETGTLLGYEGSTGFSTGSHLHLSLYYSFFTYQKNGELYFNYFEGTLNPLNYM